MRSSVILFALLVSMSNIGLNYLAAKTAQSASSWHGIFGSRLFALGFFIGMISLGSMFTLYYVAKSNHFGMANGILLMGATSIIGGTLTGRLLGNRIDLIEWIIFSLIIFFIYIRFRSNGAPEL
jgi:Ca2+/Na+ antiporter